MPIAKKKRGKKREKKKGSTLSLCQLHSFFKIAFALYMICDVPEN